MSPSSGSRGGWLGLASEVLIGLGIFAARKALRPARSLPRNTPVQYDDFVLTVTGARTLAGAPPGFTRHAVSPRVDNRAIRVPFPFRRTLAVMEDKKGKWYPVLPEDQRTLDQADATPDPLAAPLPPGRSTSTELAFHLPAEARNPTLRITAGFPIGELLTTLYEGRTRLRIDRSELAPAAGPRGAGRKGFVGRLI